MTKSAFTKTTCALTLLFLGAVSGCSVLGLPTNSVSHVLTDDTKQVIQNSPRLGRVARERAKMVESQHHLQPGDELLIETVSGESEIRLPADQRVMPDGTIDLGKFGRLVVASMTLEQSEAEIQNIIVSVEEKSVAVNVQLIQSVDRYYVIGEVNSPGAFPLIGHETVLDAILEAGGLTGKASACDLLLARPTDPCSCRVAMPVCYRAITQLGDTTSNYHLKPGDRIFVGKQSLCEELRSYCKAGKTCERCCTKQVACRTPNAASRHTADFVAPLTKMIPAPVLPFVHSTATPHDSQLQQVAPDSPPIPYPRPTVQPQNVIPNSTDSGATPPNRVQNDRLDGELDFKSFLRDHSLIEETGNSAPKLFGE